MQIRHYSGSLCEDSKLNKCNKEKRLKLYFHINKLRKQCSIRKIKQRPPPPWHRLSAQVTHMRTSYMCRCFLPRVPHLPACTKQIHMYGYMDKCACLLFGHFSVSFNAEFQNLSSYCWSLYRITIYSNSVSAVRSEETAPWGTPHVEAYICAARSPEIYSWVVRMSDRQAAPMPKSQKSWWNLRGGRWSCVVLST